MEPSEEIQEPTQEDVLGVLRNVAQRLVEELGRGAVGLSPELLREKVLGVLSSDEGASVLLSTAWAEGFTEAVREQEKQQGRVVATPGDPLWRDVAGPGERKVRQREENLCERCTHAGVCGVRRAMPAELMQVLTRCLVFSEATR